MIGLVLVPLVLSGAGRFSVLGHVAVVARGPMVLWCWRQRPCRGRSVADLTKRLLSFSFLFVASFLFFSFRQLLVHSPIILSGVHYEIVSPTVIALKIHKNFATSSGLKIEIDVELNLNLQFFRYKIMVGF